MQGASNQRRQQSEGNHRHPHHRTRSARRTESYKVARPPASRSKRRHGNGTEFRAAVTERPLVLAPGSDGTSKWQPHLPRRSLPLICAWTNSIGTLLVPLMKCTSECSSAASYVTTHPS